MAKQARSKTRKAVSKRVKLTGTGKVKINQSGRRHLAASKNAKRKRHLATPNMAAESDVPNIKANLPFHKHR